MVYQVVLTLSRIHSEESLLVYLISFVFHYIIIVSLRVLQKFTFSVKTSVNLQTILQRLSLAGGPLYPTESVRREALITYHILFPVG